MKSDKENKVKVRSKLQAVAIVIGLTAMVFGVISFVLAWYHDTKHIERMYVLLFRYITVFGLIAYTGIEIWYHSKKRRWL